MKTWMIVAEFCLLCAAIAAFVWITGDPKCLVMKCVVVQQAAP